MALAASLIPGFQYRITSGLLEDEVVTILDNTPFPDCEDIAATPKGEDSKHKLGLPHHCTDPEGLARKITVRLSDGSTDYMLPRVLDGQPVGVDSPAMPAFVDVVDPVNEVPQTVTEVLKPLLDTTARGFKVDPITDPMDKRLDHLRPSRTKIKRYISRVMPNGMTDVEFLLAFASDAYRGDNQGRPENIALKGDTQSGKTFLVEVLAVAWADAMGLPKPMPIFTLSGSSGVTDYDLFGQTTSYTDPATGQESLVWLPGIVDLAAQCGGILYLDEINAMGERVTSSLFPLLDHRHHFINRNKPVLKGGQFMPEATTGSLDLWIIATYNEGYRGMSDMNEAILNRFKHLMWDYDDAVESKLIKSPTVRLLGEALRTARKANKLRTPCGTSALQGLERDCAAFGAEMGLTILVGLFKGQERAVVESIIEDRSIIVLLNEEAKQAAVEARMS